MYSSLSFNPLSRRLLLPLLLLLLQGIWLPREVVAQAFDAYDLDLNGFNLDDGTALEFGPDNRLYVAERYGLIRVFTVDRIDDANGVSYKVIAGETIDLVQVIPNHNDNGQPGGPSTRQVTGITVVGTATNPVIYVSSSDSRVGAGGGGGDEDLDTNSGTITRITWTGSNWDAVDILRGLPRSEENHANNGMQVLNISGTNYLLIASGGNTNGGAPSNNFAYITEFAWAAAVVALDLDAIDAMPIKTDTRYTPVRKYVYDLPTLDDPTRANVNGIENPDDVGYDGIDINDPFGGQDGLNQSMVLPGGPLYMVSPGYRNTYDLVVTQDGKLYVTDNGGNGGWGGYPENEANANTVTNDYITGEPGSIGYDNTNQENGINNKDHLNLVTTDIQSYVFNSVYGGHPCPIRANPGVPYDGSGFPFNPGGAGLFTKGTHSAQPGGGDEFFRTQILDPTDPNFESQSLPVNWPPVHASLINPDNADFRNPGETNPDGPDDISVLLWKNNTNAIDEYTATNFGGAMQGDLIAGRNGGGYLHRIQINPDGTVAQYDDDWLATSSYGNALGLTCQGDADIFPGSIWVANFNDHIHIFEPNDFVLCIAQSDPAFDPLADYDGDLYTNQDEIDNGTDYCSGGATPKDYDGDKISDLNDTDDDGDGILDQNDPFQLGSPFDLPYLNELFNYSWKPGYANLGFTGLMNDGSPTPNWINWLDNPPGTPNDILGGAVGAMTVYQTAGDALTNDQEKAFQYGVNVSTATGDFTVDGLMKSPFHTFTAGQSQGLFIGTGFQDDYLKVVIGENQHVRVEGENGGVFFSAIAPTDISLPDNTENPNLRLMFLIDPVAGTAQVRYQIIINSGPNSGEGPYVDLGTPISLSGALLTAVQDANTPLAVGMIGTAAGGASFPANWESLYVSTNAPYVTSAMPDLQRITGSPSEIIDLNSYFDDNQGQGNITYSIQGNTAPAIGASLSGTNLTITFPSPGNADTTEITIRATDADGLFVEETFKVETYETPVVLFRVNAKGPTLTAPDGGLDWVTDDNNPTLATDGFTFIGGVHSTGNGDGVNWHPSVDASVIAATPWAVFQSERSDLLSSPNELKYTFDVGNPGIYTLRLFVKDSYWGTGSPGDRIFDVKVNDFYYSSLDNIDVTDQFGHKVGGLIEVTVPLTTGNLITVEFIHGVENPLINAIEILSGQGPNIYPDLQLASIPDQTHSEMDSPILFVEGTGGNSSENFAFSATGLPPGLSIEPTNGSILGAISSGAAVNSPYNVTITAQKNNSPATTTSFTWNVRPVNSVLYRVNVGGAATASPDGSSPNWESGISSPYQTGGPASIITGDDPGAHTGAIGLQHSSVTTGVPQSLFNTAIIDDTDDGNQMAWQFAANNGDNLTVRFYFAELDGSVTGSGQRSFNIQIDGVAIGGLQNIDVFNEAGAKSGYVVEASVVSDGTLDILFDHGYAGSPMLNGIEIINESAASTSFPVEWLSIKAELLPSEEIRVSWKTAAEINTSHFVVERSSNGDEFHDVGRVEAAGFSDEVQSYQLMDGAPTSRFTYYKIRQVDLDGGISYSSMVQVLNDRRADDLWVYPNPGSDQVFLRLPRHPEGDKVKVQVFDIAGRQVLSQEMTHRVEDLELNTASLADNRLYLILVQYENGDYYRRRWSKQ